MNVNDKVAVVTGGASGIGLALCTRFATEGAHVVLSDLDQEACNRHAAPIGALPVAADVGPEEDIKNLVAEHFGRVDLLFRTPVSPSTEASTRPPTSGRRSSASTWLSWPWPGSGSP
jgi:NADP-dependent 3-hydroxy acid dehydrogenase YdfG